MGRHPNPNAFAVSGSVVVSVMLLGFIADASRAAADDEDGIGIVAEYRPAAGRYNFTRGPGAENVPVRIGTIVMAGDKLSLPAGSSVLVRLADGKSVQYVGPKEVTVPDAPPLGKVATFLKSLKDVYDHDYRREGTAESRGGETCAAPGEPVRPIDVPILAPGARIIAGERDLPLAWRGGCAPYVVTLLAGADKLVDRESIEGRQVRLDDVRLVPGRYEVRIADATGLKYEASLEVLSAGPVIPVELAADNSALGVIAQAVWLADQDGGRWRLDSFEKLRPLIRAGDPLAGTIGDGVLWGSPR
jgi:hypothetical protein